MLVPTNMPMTHLATAASTGFVVAIDLLATFRRALLLEVRAAVLYAKRCILSLGLMKTTTTPGG